MVKKNIIQFTLIILLIIISGFFYKKYMVSNDTNMKLLEKKNDANTTTENLNVKEDKETENIIENLRYTSNDIFGNTYIINAQSAKLDESKINQVTLFEVMAKIIQKDDEIIYINSSIADYNKINNDTIFKKNVNVKYHQDTVI